MYVYLAVYVSPVKREEEVERREQDREREEERVEREEGGDARSYEMIADTGGYVEGKDLDRRSCVSREMLERLLLRV